MFWFLLACSEQKVGVFNTPPSAQIVSPTVGEEFFVGSQVLLEGVVSDPNDIESSLNVQWSWSEGAICEDSVPDPDGLVYCSVQMPEEDRTVSLRVQDSVGAIDIAEVVLTLAEEAIPQVEILSPLASQTHYVDRLISFSAQLSDEDSSLTNLETYWESSLDGVLDVDTTVDSAGLIEDYAYLTQGEHAITLWVEDDRGNRSKKIEVIQVGPPNRSPECSLDTLEGTSIVGNSVLFSGTATDLDIASNLLEVTWKSDIDGILDISSPNSSGEVLFSTSQLTIGQHIITMEVRDEVGELCSDTVVYTILTDNTAPEINAVNITPFPALSDSLLTCIPLVNDADGDSLSIDYSWSNLSTGLSLGSNSTVQLSASTVLPGHQLECAVSVDDGNGGVVQATGLTTIENSEPVLSNLSISPSTPKVGDIVSCYLQASDIDDDVLSVSYSWTNIGTGDVLGSGDSVQLVQGSITRGDILRCTVEVSDQYGGVVSDYAQETIANSLPQIDSLSVSPAVVYANTDVEATATASDADGDVLELLYAWSVNGSVIQQTDLSILDAGFYTRGDVISVEVTPSDPVGDGVSQSYGPFTVQNSPPSAPVVYIEPQEPIVEFDDLQCVVDEESEDADGDTVTYSILWTVDGVLYTGPTLTSSLSGDTVVYSETLGYEDWSCSVLPNDGIDTGSAGTDTVTVIPCAD